LVFRACSGALISNVFDVEQVHEGVPDSEGLQIGADQLGPNGKLDQKVSLITVTIGGNDMQFADVLSFCARRSQCMDDMFGICGSLRTCIESNLQSVDADLKHFFEELRSVAGPKVRIVALGYPALFPGSLRYRDCELIRAWDPSERTAIRAFGARLDETIAQNAMAVGADYLNTFRYFSGHEPCTPVPWLNYVNLPGGDTIVDGSFHPNALGQAMMARMVACQLVTYPTAAEAAAAAENDLVAACVAQGAGQSPATPSPSPSG
jgi:lysophospholipase L1-like esterase